VTRFFSSVKFNLIYEEKRIIKSLVSEWVTLIELNNPKEKRNCPSFKIEAMFCMYLLINWFKLSNERIEDAIFNSYIFRKFMKMIF